MDFTFLKILLFFLSFANLRAFRIGANWKSILTVNLTLIVVFIPLGIYQKRRGSQSQTKNPAR